MEQSAIWDKLYSRNLHWAGETKEVPHVLENKTVLELGVGNGKTLRSILKQKPGFVHAIDFSEKAIALCKSRFKHQNLTILQANMLKMPFAENCFDAVVCYYTLNSLVQREEAVQEIFRVLKVGGILLFEDFAVGDFRQTDRNNDTKIKKDGLVCHYFSEDELLRLFKGFKDIRIQTKSYRAYRNLLVDRKIIRMSATSCRG